MNIFPAGPVRRLLFVMAALVVLGGGYYLLRYQAWAAYRTWSINKMNNMAVEFLEADDPRNAMLMVRKVLGRRPNDVTALRLAVRAANARSLPDAVVFQRSLNRIEPSVEGSLELIRLALRYRAYSYALTVIPSIGPEARELPEYHRLAAEVYRRVNRDTSAKYHLISLLGLLPNDPPARLALAEVEYAIDPAGLPADWPERVQALTLIPEVEIAARFLQLQQAVAGGDAAAAAGFAAPLRDRPGLDLDQRLQLLAAASLADESASIPQLLALQADAATDPVAVVRVMEHLERQDEPGRIWTWYPNLDDSIRADGRVQHVTARALLTLGEWAELERLLRPARWETDESLRLALLAHASRRLSRPVDFADSWRLALIATGQDVNSVVRLLRTVESWQWEAERHDVLWKLFNLLPTNRTVHEQLIAREFRDGNTANLNRIYARIAEADPADTDAGNNFAYTSLLLNTNLARAQIIARDLHRQHPENTSYLTTYAMALHRQGESAQALALLEQLDATTRLGPGARLLEAVTAAATGQAARASELIRELSRARMLPEERSLVIAATGLLNRDQVLDDRTRLMAQAEARGAESAGWTGLLPEPPERTTDIQLAEAHYREKNYQALLALLRETRWDGPPHLRHALQAFAGRELAQTALSREYWRQAVVAAGRDARRLRDLDALAENWAWTPERMEIATRRFEAAPTDRALLAELLAHYRSEARTPEMMRVLWLYVNQTEATGAEAAWCVYYSLLCGLNESPAQILAARIYGAAPTDPRHRVAYAFSLWRQKRPDEAWKLLEGQGLLEPGGMQSALVEAGVLLELGRKADAETALKRFSPEGAVPEEIALAGHLAGLLAMDRPMLATTQP